MGAGDSKITGEVNPNNILNSGVQLLEGTTGLDVGEEVQWLDRVIPKARLSEVVRGGHWRILFHELTPGQLK